MVSRPTLLWSLFTSVSVTLMSTGSNSLPSIPHPCAYLAPISILPDFWNPSPGSSLTHSQSSRRFLLIYPHPLLWMFLFSSCYWGTPTLFWESFSSSAFLSDTSFLSHTHFIIGHEAVVHLFLALLLNSFPSHFTENTQLWVSDHLTVSLRTPQVAVLCRCCGSLSLSD